MLIGSSVFVRLVGIQTTLHLQQLGSIFAPCACEILSDSRQIFCAHYLAVARSVMASLQICSTLSISGLRRRSQGDSPGWLVVSSLGLATINLQTKFKFSDYADYEDMQNLQIGVVRVLRGHSKSLAMSWLRTRNKYPSVRTRTTRFKNSFMPYAIAVINNICSVWHVCIYFFMCLRVQMPSVLWRCWLGGRKGIRPVKKWVVRCWRGYLSGARCRLAYSPADATATHYLLLQ